MSLFGDLKYGPDFKHFDYVNPNAPKGGTMRLSAIGTFDTLNPFVVKGVPAAGIGGIFDTLTVALRGRARQRIRPRRRKHRTRPRQALGALHAAQGGAVSRRHADDAGGRRLDLRDAAGEGPADVPLLLRRRDQGREGGRARRPLLVQIGGQPRIAADHRRDAGAVEGLLVRPRFREDDARPAARQRPLQDRVGRSRPLDHLSPGGRLLGRRSAGQQGPLQCRRHPLRLLSRRHDRARGVQGRAIRRAAREFVKELGDRI